MMVRDFTPIFPVIWARSETGLDLRPDLTDYMEIRGAE